MGLITFPILTRILTKEQYGILGLVTTTMLISVAVAKAGLSEGIIRFYKEYSKIPEHLTVFSSTVLVRGVVLAFLTVLLYVALFPVINQFLHIDKKYIICFTIMGIYLFIRPLNIIVYNFLRVNDRTIFLNIIGLFEKIISIGLSLFLLLYVIHELYGFFIGVIIAEFAASIVLFYWFFTNYKITLEKTSRNLTVTLIKFGLPLLFSELSFLLLSYADRYLIVAYYGEATLGLYSVGYNLAMYVANIIMFALSYTIVPIYVEIYGKEGRKKTEEFLQRCMYYLLIAVIPICFGYLAVSKDLFITLASEKYAAAATFSPLILIGSLFLGLNSIFNAGLYLKKKTMTMLFIMVLAVIVNITMNLILLPKYGVMGAAVSALVTCIIGSILSISLSYRYIVVRVDIKTVL
ncbi:MAG: oligosaccharide flippase family protein, partial [Nitrospirota bacterium]|nr:oligosaccharide flippase family protein [Nitrospirota bacterium]